MADTRTITDIRRELVAESEGCHQRSRPYLEAMKSQSSSFAEFDAYEGLTTSGNYAWTLAAVLRAVDEGRPEAVPAIVEASMYDGVEWLEHANDDLGTASAGVS